MHHNGYLDWGENCNSWGDCGCHYFYKAGFDKLVSWHNYHVCFAEYKASDGGKFWDSLWQARSDRAEAAEQEENRKREERKAKRAAARKAKQEAQETQQ